MLRIIRSPSLKIIDIALEGKLLQPWIDEVRCVVTAAGSEGRVRLDLSRLSFADEPGLTFLRELRSDGVELLARSALLAGLMDRAPVDGN